MVDTLSTVSEWLPTDRTTLENLVLLCKDNIEGVSYRDKFANNLPKAWTLTPAYEATLRNILASASEKLKAVDPAYEAPKIEKKNADNCFVVTSVMGDAGHPTVIFMRHFRDEWLLRRSWGVRIINLYDYFGPAVARFIEVSPIRRRISLLLIVRPCEWMARRLL